VWYQNIRSASFSFVTIYASGRQTGRQTDRIATAIPCVVLHAARWKLKVRFGFVVFFRHRYYAVVYNVDAGCHCLWMNDTMTDRRTLCLLFFERSATVKVKSMDLGDGEWPRRMTSSYVTTEREARRLTWPTAEMLQRGDHSIRTKTTPALIKVWESLSKENKRSQDNK